MKNKLILAGGALFLGLCMAQPAMARGHHRHHHGHSGGHRGGAHHHGVRIHKAHGAMSGARYHAHRRAIAPRAVYQRYFADPYVTARSYTYGGRYVGPASPFPAYNAAGCGTAYYPFNTPAYYNYGGCAITGAIVCNRY